MTNEIKEIYLSNLEWTKTHDNDIKVNDDMGGVIGNIVFKDNMSYEEFQKLFKSGYFILCDKDYITNLQHHLVYCLKYETGAGIRDCKMALEKCDYNYNIAYKYLRLISDGVARWKIVDGQRVKWTDEDYIKCARGDE